MTFLTALGWVTLGAIALTLFSAIILVFILGVVAIKVAFEKTKEKEEYDWQKGLLKDLREQLQEQDDEA